MDNPTVGDVLEFVQTILGEAPGGFYNVRQRVKLINQAQREMMHDALIGRVEVSIPAHGKKRYFLPGDFVTFTKANPVWDNHTSTSPIEVKDSRWMDEHYPSWRDHAGRSPQYLVDMKEGEFRLYPSPHAGAGKLTISYISAPDDLWSEDDPVLNDNPALSRYYTALAYNVASKLTLGIAPDASANFRNLYFAELRSARENNRSNAQHSLKIRPRKFRRD